MENILFVDVEWNQIFEQAKAEDCDILQIGCSSFENKQCVKKFFRVVRPQDISAISNNTYRMMHLSESVLLAAKPVEIVLDKMISLFPMFDTLVVWSQNSLEVLEYYMNRTGHKPKQYRAVVLQEVLRNITKDASYLLSFTRALDYFGVEYDKNLLHVAKHDVEYLSRLYEAIKREYEKIYSEENDKWCYRTGESGVLHVKGCHYIERGHEIRTYSKNQVLLGTPTCHLCNRKGGFAHISMEKRTARSKFNLTPSFEDEYIEAVCELFNVQCTIGYGVIFIRTKYASWRIYHNYENIEDVFHENYRIKKSEFKNRKKANAGYHKQDISGNLYEVIRYIADHDRNFVKKISKDRMDVLFERIRQERLAREE